MGDVLRVCTVILLQDHGGDGHGPGKVSWLSGMTVVCCWSVGRSGKHTGHGVCRLALMR